MKILSEYEYNGELPFEIPKTIYQVHFCRSNGFKKISEHTINSFLIYPDKTICPSYEYGHGGIEDLDYDGIYYDTIEEAEKRLKELEDGE